VALGVAEPDWLQWLLFSVLSVVTLAFLRRPIMMKLAPAGSDRVDTLVGETATAAEDISLGSGSARRHLIVPSGFTATTSPAAVVMYTVPSGPITGDEYPASPTSTDHFGTRGTAAVEGTAIHPWLGPSA